MPPEVVSAPAKRRWLPLAAVGAVLVVGAAAIGLRSQPPSGDALGAEPEASGVGAESSPSSIEIGSAPAPRAKSAALAIPATPPPSASAPPSPDAGKAGAAKPGPAAKPAATGTKVTKPATGDRAEKHGVAKENPFE